MKAPGLLQFFPRCIFPFALALCAYVILWACSLKAERLPVGVWWSVQAVGWISCLWFLRTVRSGWPSVRWILVTALAFRVCGLCAPPPLEDDYQRYLWDGWRTIQDGSPYDRAPLEYFRVSEKRPTGIETALNELNNPDLATIYAPVTQLLFAAGAALAPGSLLALKLLLLLVDGALLFLLVTWAGRGAAWFYGWCPLVVTENAFHAHPEAWALLWLIAALICARRERWIVAGALAGVAVGAKLFAVLAVPFLVWRRPKLVLPACLIALGLIYGPIFASGSSAEWAGMRVMARSFEFNSFGYALLATVFGSAAARVLWLVFFGLTAAFLFVRWARQKRSLQEAPLAAEFFAFFIFTPVLNPWYAVWLVPFLAIAPTASGMALLVVVPLSYATGLNLGHPTLATYAQPDWVRGVEFGLVLLASVSRFWSAQKKAWKLSLFR